MREMLTDKQVVQAAQDKERKKQVAEMEEKLANELERRHAERIREAQNRKRICESSEELRALKEKLHAAQVTKQRAAQIMEKQITYEEERRRDELMAEVMESDRLAKLEAEQAVEIGKFNLREEARKESRIEFEKERAMVDDVVRKIQEEDEAEERLRRQKQEETRAELQSFAQRQ